MRTTYTVTDPRGIVHTRSTYAEYTHAIIRRTRGQEHYTVEWSNAPLDILGYYVWLGRDEVVLRRILKV